MKITLFMTISLNGIIARPDYREDFLSRQNWDSFLECAYQTGALIWGRNTQEKVRRYAPKAFDQMKDLAKIVVSTDKNLFLEEGFELANSPQDAIDMLQNKGLETATLAGGSILNSSFAKEQLIDEVKINLESVVIGRGIPVFAPDDFDMKLILLGFKQVNERIVQLHYHVPKL